MPHDVTFIYTSRQYIPASAKKGRDGTNVLVKNAAPKIVELLKQKTG